jgi:hypothetical protein
VVVADQVIHIPARCTREEGKCHQAPGMAEAWLCRSHRRHAEPMIESDRVPGTMRRGRATPSRSICQ